MKKIKKPRARALALSLSLSARSSRSSCLVPVSRVSRDNVILRRGEFEPLSSGDTVVVAMAMRLWRGWFRSKPPHPRDCLRLYLSLSPSRLLALSLSRSLQPSPCATFNLIKRGLYRTARWRGGKKKSLQRDKGRSCASRRACGIVEMLLRLWSAKYTAYTAFILLKRCQLLIRMMKTWNYKRYKLKSEIKCWEKISRIKPISYISVKTIFILVI